MSCLWRSQLVALKILWISSPVCLNPCLANAILRSTGTPKLLMSPCWTHVSVKHVGTFLCACPQIDFRYVFKDFGSFYLFWKLKNKHKICIYIYCHIHTVSCPTFSRIAVSLCHVMFVLVSVSMLLRCHLRFCFAFIFLGCSHMYITHVLGFCPFLCYVNSIHNW